MKSIIKKIIGSGAAAVLCMLLIVPGIVLAAGEKVPGNLPVIGTLKNGTETYYVVDHSKKVPDNVSFDYELVEGHYNGAIVTYITDKSHNVQLLYLADSAGNFTPYAVGRDSKIYPALEMKTEDGGDYVFVSAKAALSVPSELKDDAAAMEGAIYAVDQTGAAGFYNITEDSSLVAWAPRQAGISLTTILIIVGAVIIVAIIVLVIILIVRKRKNAVPSNEYEEEDEDGEDEDLDIEFIDVNNK